MLHLFLLSWLAFHNSASCATLKLTFQDLKTEKGNILYLIFKSKSGFPSDENKAVKAGSVSANMKSIEIHLSQGEYAVSVIHDENNNNKLDTFLGIPKEGFGFSNNPRIFFGPPSFNDAHFRFDQNQTIKIKMKHL